MAETGYPRLVVVDDKRHLVGVVSSLDVIRGLVGIPAEHPGPFPHFDAATGLVWTDDHILSDAHLDQAPDGPGVLVLVSGAASIPDRVVWAEESTNLRQRVSDILTRPQGEPPIRFWLERGTLRFRCAASADPAERRRAVAVLRASQPSGRLTARPTR
jgi:CBS domain-containing protein